MLGGAPATSNNDAMNETKVTEALTRLQQYRKIGPEAVSRERKTGTYSPGLAKELAAELKTSEANVQKAWQFAKDYSDDEFDELCELRTADGKPISWGHVTKLLSVTDKRSRRALQRRAAKEGWSARALEREIRRKQPEKRSHGGGKLAKPTSRDELLREVLAKCEQWRRWCQQREAEADGKIGFDVLPRTVITAVTTATKAVEALESKTRKAIQG